MQTRKDNKRRGIMMMLIACLVFSLMDAVMKRLATDFPPMQVTALRALCSLPLIMAYISWRRTWATLWQIRWPLHVFRIVLGVLMLTLFAFALKHLPLTEAYALFYISPLAIATLSIPLLGERVPKSSWIAIIVGIVGVLIVLKPTGLGMVSVSGFAILAAALCYAFSAITVRILSRTDSTESMVFWLMLGVAVVASLMAAPGWLPILPQHYWLLVALAITGFIGQVTITEAFKLAPSATVTPFEYSALVWSLGLDLLIWNTLPGTRVFLGTTIIVASGVYLARHEASGMEAEHP